jgi:hypothetical protein
MRIAAPIVTALLAALGYAARPAAQPQPLPVIDMHVHADAADAQGPPPLGLCVPVAAFPAGEPGRPWAETFLEFLKKPPCASPIWSPVTDREVMDRTLAVLRRRNVYGLTSGPLIEMWRQADSNRILPSLGFEFGPAAPSLDAMRELFKTKRFLALAEVAIQYQGREPGDPAFEPYLALAETMDVPVGIHVGTGPPGAPYLGFPNYRARLHSPLLIEDVLLRHPKLRIYLMHAGWPMLDDLLAVMWAHPQLYVDVGAINFALPRAAFYSYLQRIVDTGFGRRVMFGSDQMLWPEVIDRGIDAIEDAPFLNAEQKRDILYNNAVRFLRLPAVDVARHHGK